MAVLEIGWGKWITQDPDLRKSKNGNILQLGFFITKIRKIVMYMSSIFCKQKL